MVQPHPHGKLQSLPFRNQGQLGDPRGEIVVVVRTCVPQKMISRFPLDAPRIARTRRTFQCQSKWFSAWIESLEIFGEEDSMRSRDGLPIRAASERKKRKY